MALTGKDSVAALLPSMTSDGSDSSDDEEIPVKLHDVIDSSDTDTSEAPSIPEQAAAAMEDIMNNLSDTDDAFEAGVIPTVQSTPVKIKYKCSTPKTSYAITPLKTRSHFKPKKVEKNTRNFATNGDHLKENIAVKKKKGKGKKKKLDCCWTNDRFAFRVDIPEDNFTTPDKMKTPYEYFQTFFSDDLLQMAVDNTNLYSVQQTGKSICFTVDEMRDFLAIQILMGIVEMPAYTDYWSQKFRYDDIAEVMSLKRYQQIRRYIHFVNNANQNDDPYFKIRPALEIVRRNCIAVEEEKKQSIDEIMVPYKGKKAGYKSRYIKSKPKRWGFKIFVRASVSGIVYDFVIYGGEQTFREYHQFTSEEDSLGLGAKVILSLCKSVKNPICSAVYFDNFFSSLELLHILRNNYGILSLGTIRSNRLGNCILENDKVLAKKGRGSFCCKNDNVNKISCVKWFDNKAVILVSTYVSVEPVVTATRYNKNKNGKIEIPCPNIVKQYNRHMGGVDLMDMLVSLYRTRLKSRRWYLSIFAQMVDLCMNNAWLLYRREKSLCLQKQAIVWMK
nr:unnamed protein product [Callosobruchus analis]